MIYHDGGGHALKLYEETDHPPFRTFRFVINQATCDECWHARHDEPVATCLTCNPPQPLEAAA